MNLKKFLPVENYTLSSKLTVEEVRKRIANNIEPKKNFRFSLISNSYSKPYEGSITGNSFTISRVINYRNSFLPEITGTISSFIGQTQVKIKMQPVTFVLVFISLWLGLVGFVCFIVLIGITFQYQEIFKDGASPFSLIPFAMFVFGCLLTYFAFKKESKKSKAFLAALLEGEEISS
jgi:hypothetical protein